MEQHYTQHAGLYTQCFHDSRQTVRLSIYLSIYHESYYLVFTSDTAIRCPCVTRKAWPPYMHTDNTHRHLPKQKIGLPIQNRHWPLSLFAKKHPCCISEGPIASQLRSYNNKRRACEFTWTFLWFIRPSREQSIFFSHS